MPAPTLQRSKESLDDAACFLLLLASARRFVLDRADDARRGESMNTCKRWLPVVVACSALCGPVPLALADDTGKPNQQMQTVLDALQKLAPKPIETLPPTLARDQASAADAVIQVIQDKGTIAPDKLPAVGKVELRTIPGPEAPLPVRVYTPKGDGPFPVIVYFHGGGWVLGSLDSSDATCRGLTDLNSALVVSVDYRRAPEHKFPAATEDAYAALQYVLAHAQELGGDPARVAVAGESAGANLATVACLMAAERGGKQPVHQVLLYPVTNYAFDTPSYRANANARPLAAAMMPWFYKHYLRRPADGENVFVSPLRATSTQLSKLPPATIVTAGLDPLQDDGTSYAAKLAEAGVDTARENYDGVTHEFFGMGPVVDEAKAANAFVAKRLRAAFKGK
jgi:acetyl esterase